MGWGILFFRSHSVFFAMTDKTGDVSVSIMGGGLAGSLAAVLLGKKGFNVDVYEKRDDSRSETFQWEGKSINLALSTRGRKALRKAGIEDQVVAQVGFHPYLV